MRLIFVNQCHPGEPHVCALRLRSFAEAAAGQGHQVVLLTGQMGRCGAGGQGIAPEALPQALAAHDWTRPFHLACPSKGWRRLAAAREGRLPALLRKPLIAGAFALGGSVHLDWRAGSRPYWPVLARAFQPQAVWGTFVPAESWAIAAGIAAEAGCPWVADIKDFWYNFVPAPLRGLVARRYRGAAAMTCFSETHRAEAERWFPQPKTVVYSGIPNAQLAPLDAGAGDGSFRLSLTGSVYDGQALAALSETLAAWLGGLSQDDRRRVTFIYAGNDHKRVDEATAGLAGLCRREIHHFLDGDSLFALFRGCNANIYVKNWHCYHHKTMELLASGRPVVSFPGETGEALAMARSVKAEFHACDGAEALRAALDSLWRRRHLPPVDIDRRAMAAFSWEAQAQNLAGILGSV